MTGGKTKPTLGIEKNVTFRDKEAAICMYVCMYVCCLICHLATKPVAAIVNQHTYIVSVPPPNKPASPFLIHFEALVLPCV